MIVIINGSVGVGKTSVSRELQEKFNKSIMLDGDYIGAVRPFEIYDQSRINYLYKTLQHLIEFHISNGFEHFIINYVFESNSSLSNLIHLFDKTNLEVKCIWLTCSVEEHKKRILSRETDQKDWELKRFIELNNIQKKANNIGFIGEKIETDGKTIKEITEIIWDHIHQKTP